MKVSYYDYKDKYTAYRKGEYFPETKEIELFINDTETEQFERIRKYDLGWDTTFRIAKKFNLDDQTARQVISAIKIKGIDFAENCIAEATNGETDPAKIELYKNMKKAVEFIKEVK